MIMMMMMYDWGINYISRVPKFLTWSVCSPEKTWMDIHTYLSLQNKPLQSSRGIIITNQTLVLQSISKQTHGQYMCRASNAQGTVSSNDLYLDVKCKMKWLFYIYISNNWSMENLFKKGSPTLGKTFFCLPKKMLP